MKFITVTLCSTKLTSGEVPHKGVAQLLHAVCDIHPGTKTVENMQIYQQCQS